MEERVPSPVRQALRRVVDMSVGEAAEVTLSNGGAHCVQLLEVTAADDSVRRAIRQAQVRVRVDEQEVWLPSGGYRLPAAVGSVQVDCPITRSWLRNSGGNPWALEKDARLRFWPAGSPLLEPGALLYPARQRWSPP